jgi:hypothetical protein
VKRPGIWRNRNVVINGASSTCRGIFDAILQLRSVHRSWAILGAEAIFSNFIIFQHIIYSPVLDDRLPETRHGDWFVPCRGKNAVEGMEIIIRYRIGHELPRGSKYFTTEHERKLLCSRKVLCLGTSQHDWSGLTVLSDTQGINHTPFVQSVPRTGLQVRGYHFRTMFMEIPHNVHIWNTVVQAFIWTLMESPDEALREDSKYVLNLGLCS